MRTRVVIVDDVFDIRFLVRQRLEQRGADVVGEAATPEEAFTLVTDTAPDAVVTDLFVSGDDPGAYVRRFREIQPSLCVVLMSATAPTDPGISAALAAGADGYFDKAEGFARLAEGVLQVCHEHRGGV